MDSKRESCRNLIVPDIPLIRVNKDHDLREVYWCSGVKKGIVEFVSKCPICQQVKVEHQRTGGLAYKIELLEWMWEMINMDFITSLPSFTRNMILFGCLSINDKVSPFYVGNDFPFNRGSQKYIQEVVRLHGVPVSIFRMCTI